MSEKVISLISGGIDSPLSTLIASRKFDIVPLNFCLYPSASEESSKTAFDTLKDLDDRLTFEKIKIFPWGGFLKKIRKEVPNWLVCVGCRKGMLKVSEMIAKEENAKGIVTGEAIGQKASQTIENIRATSFGIELPLIRPLIGLNKEEIIDLSKDKNIFRKNHAGCCLATPKNPGTKVQPEKLDKELENIDFESLFKEFKDISMDISSMDEFDLDSYLFKLAGKLE